MFFGETIIQEPIANSFDDDAGILFTENENPAYSVAWPLGRPYGRSEQRYDQAKNGISL